MAPLVYHLDDSTLALRTFGTGLKAVDPSLELRSFQEFSLLQSDLLEALRQGRQVLVLFTDYLMPGVTGADVLKQLKSHPLAASIPMFVVTAEQSSPEVLETKRLGARGIIHKPIALENIEAALAEAKSALSLRPDAEFFAAFLEEYADAVEHLKEQIRPCLESQAPFDEARFFELYRQLHTLKGGTGVIGLTPLSLDIHVAEEFLQRNKPKPGEVVSSTVAEILGAFLEHLLQTEVRLRVPEPVPALPEEVRVLLTSKTLSASAGKTAAPSSAPARDAGAGTPAPRKTLRISQEAIDQLHVQLKSVIQAKHKLKRFQQELIQEFPDEAFPSTLGQPLQQLETASQSMLEFFISLRLVPAKRLHDAANRVLAETLRQVPKAVQLQWDAPADMELDPPILECLEHAVTHWIRNALDHGIEAEETRQTRNKPKEGQLTLKLERVQSDQFEVRLKDDGGGIQAHRLVQKLVSQGLISEEQASAMDIKQQLGLVFVDGLSSKDEASTVSGRGVGMGAIKAEVERLGGSIDVESTLEKGTEFKMVLPRIFKL